MEGKIFIFKLYSVHRNVTVELCGFTFDDFDSCGIDVVLCSIEIQQSINQ